MIDGGAILVVAFSTMFLTMLWHAARINRSTWCERRDQTGQPIGHVVIDGRCAECGRRLQAHH